MYEGAQLYNKLPPDLWSTNWKGDVLRYLKSLDIIGMMSIKQQTDYGALNEIRRGM